MNFSGPISQTYSSLFFKNLGANDFLLGVIGFAGSVIAFVQFPSGYLADKHGRRRLIVTMTYGMTFSYILFILAPSWSFIVLGLIVQNFCLLYQPALFALMLDSVPPERRGAGFTIQSVIMNIVSLPAAIITYVSPQLLFILLAIGAIPPAIIASGKILEPSAKQV
jgi:MFS family permease